MTFVVTARIGNVRNTIIRTDNFDIASDAAIAHVIANGYAAYACHQYDSGVVYSADDPNKTSMIVSINRYN